MYINLLKTQSYKNSININITKKWLKKKFTYIFYLYSNTKTDNNFIESNNRYIHNNDLMIFSYFLKLI